MPDIDLAKLRRLRRDREKLNGLHDVLRRLRQERLDARDAARLAALSFSRPLPELDPEALPIRELAARPAEELAAAGVDTASLAAAIEFDDDAIDYQRQIDELNVRRMPLAALVRNLDKFAAPPGEMLP